MKHALEHLQQLFDMEGRGYAQLRADLRELGVDEPPLLVGVAVLAILIATVAFGLAALPDTGAFR